MSRLSPARRRICTDSRSWSGGTGSALLPPVPWRLRWSSVLVFRPGCLFGKGKRINRPCWPRRAEPIAPSRGNRSGQRNTDATARRDAGDCRSTRRLRSDLSRPTSPWRTEISVSFALCSHNNSPNPARKICAVSNGVSVGQKPWRSDQDALGHSDYVNSVAYSPMERCWHPQFDHTVKLWNANTGALIATCAGHSNAVKSVAFAPNGKFFASAGDDRLIQLWDAQTHQIVLTSKTTRRAWQSRIVFWP